MTYSQRLKLAELGATIRALLGNGVVVADCGDYVALITRHGAVIKM